MTTGNVFKPSAGDNTYFADLSFDIGPTSYRGYSILINSDERNWVILSFCETEVYDAFHFILLSALDSFSIDIPALYQPGLVSIFYETSFPEASIEKISVPFGKSIIRIEADTNATDISTSLLARLKDFSPPL